MEILPPEYPNVTCQTKAARLLRFMLLLLVISLLKFFVSPADAMNDLLLVLIIWCALNAISFILLVIYQVLVVLGLVATLSVVAALIQDGRHFLSFEKTVYVALAVKGVTFIIHVIGRPAFTRRVPGLRPVQTPESCSLRLLRHERPSTAPGPGP